MSKFPRPHLIEFVYAVSRMSTAFELYLIPEIFYVIEIGGEHYWFLSLRCCKPLHVHYEPGALGEKMRLQV
jgi:hypothetical protein